jgi:hypothetical protein
MLWMNMRRSACDYGHRRIGNRVQIPDGCAAVTGDEGPTNATIPKRDGKAGWRMTPKSEDLLFRLSKSPAPSVGWSARVKRSRQRPDGMLDDLLSV